MRAAGLRLRCVALLSALSCISWSPSASAAKKRQIKFLDPLPGTRKWVDEEHPLQIHVETSGLSFPTDGHIQLNVNGGDSGVKFTQPPFVITVQDPNIGLYQLEAVLIAPNGKKTEVSAMSTVLTQRYLELAIHEEYHVSAEAPRGDSSVNGMPGLEEWELRAPDFAESFEHESKTAKNVRQRWFSRLSKDQVHQGYDVLKAYADFHAQVMSDPKLWTANDFLIYRTMDRGLGNQLESLISSFAMALLSNRVFLVDSTTVHHLFTPPPGLAWHYSVLPDNMNHDIIYDHSKLLDLRWNNPIEFEYLLCRDLKEAFPQQYLFVFSDQYYLPALRHNELYQSQLQEWFGEDIFGVLARYLMRPKEYIMQEVSTFYDRHLSNTYSVGLQVRTATMKEHDLKALVEGMDDFAWRDWINSFWKCGMLASYRAASASSYFIASDHRRVKSAADTMFGNRSHWYKQEVTRAKISGHATALIDILILSTCDDIVTTTMSTFGYVPAALAAKEPLVVSYQSTCLREITSQPCFHKWGYLMQAKCYDKTKMISPELRMCGIYSPPEQTPDPILD